MQKKEILTRVIFIAILVALCSCTRKAKSVGAIEKTGNFKDSVTYYLNQGGNDSLAKSKRLQYVYKAVRYLEGQSRQDTMYIKMVLKTAAQLYALEDFEQFHEVSLRGLDAAERVNDTTNLIRAYSFVAQYATDSNKIDSAFFCYTRAEKLALLKKDYSSLVDVYIKKAVLQSNINDFSGCELTASKSLNYLKYIDDKDITYYAYNLIGVASNEMMNYERALDYHNRALTIIRNSKDKDIYHLEESSMNNIGVVYQNQHRHREAINYFRKALSSPGLYRDSPALYAILTDNLAYSKLKSNDFSGLPNLFFKSLRIRDSLELSSGIVVNKIHLSEYYASRNDTLNSRRFARQALHLARKSKISGDILGSLKQVFAIDHNNSPQYYKEYIKISDSLQQTERKIKDRFDRIQFETEEISSENEKLEQQNRNLLYIFIGTLTIGMLLFVIRTQRAKNRELMLKQAQQKANEDIYDLMINQQNSIEESRAREKKRIAQELHDGVLGRLFGARLNLDSLNRQDSEDAVIKRNEYLTELKNIEQDIREISHDLNREKHALINNFLAILNNLLEEQRSSFEAEVSVSIDDTIKWDELDNTAKINLYRIIQESLQNINKYASAKHIHLSIKMSGKDLQLTVTDDGVGFSTNTKKKGIGLQNMVSRTEELNGTFDIRSKKGKGTALEITFPIHKKD